MTASRSLLSGTFEPLLDSFYQNWSIGNGLKLESVGMSDSYSQRSEKYSVTRQHFTNKTARDADMVDYHFLITDHPHHPGLSLACGGSAHGFKMFPVIGNYIADMLEGTLDPAVQQHWRWRPEAKASEETAEPFPTDLLDLNDVLGWSRSQARL